MAKACDELLPSACSRVVGDVRRTIRSSDGPSFGRFVYNLVFRVLVELVGVLGNFLVCESSSIIVGAHVVDGGSADVWVQAWRRHRCGKGLLMVDCFTEESPRTGVVI